MLYLALTLIMIYESVAEGLEKINSKEQLQGKPGLPFGSFTGLAEKTGVVALLAGYHKKPNIYLDLTTSKHPRTNKKTTLKSFKYYWNSADKVSVTDLRTQTPRNSGVSTEESDEVDVLKGFASGDLLGAQKKRNEDKKYAKNFRHGAINKEDDTSATSGKSGSRKEPKLAKDEVGVKGKSQFWDNFRHVSTEKSSKRKSLGAQILKKCAAFHPSTTRSREFSLFGPPRKKSLWKDGMEVKKALDYDGALNPHLAAPPGLCLKVKTGASATSDDLYIFNDEEYSVAGGEVVPLVLRSSKEEGHGSSSQDPTLLSLKGRDQSPQAKVMDKASHYFAIPAHAPCRSEHTSGGCCLQGDSEGGSSTLSPLSSLIHFAIQASPLEPPSPPQILPLVTTNAALPQQT